MNALVNRFIVLSLCVAVAGGVSGCARSNNDDVNAEMDTGSTYEPTRSGEELPEFSESWLFSPAEGLQTVYFDYDSYDLRPDALATLERNADKIKQVPGVIIQVEGHCDERGTQEYNLALGEKRALAVRQHLIRLGVSGDRIITISYGEEDPVDYGHTEAAWAKNRRAEFNRAM